MDDIKAGYMYFPVESHTIFYKVAADGIVTIVRILHQRMDISNRLKNM
jgi:toxin ParE1/3/4